MEHTTSSKEITDFDTAMEHAKSKYIFNEDLLNQNKEAQYLIVDDVMGNGSTIATILKNFMILQNYQVKLLSYCSKGC